MQEKRKRQQRNRNLIPTIAQLERVIKAAGYGPASLNAVPVVPLLNMISIIGLKDDTAFNIRVNKNTFKIESIERLSYSYTSDGRIKNIFRTKV